MTPGLSSLRRRKFKPRVHLTVQVVGEVVGFSTEGGTRKNGAAATVGIYHIWHTRPA